MSLVLYSVCWYEEVYTTYVYDMDVTKAIEQIKDAYYDIICLTSL